MSAHLLIVTLGPVQEFIAQARRTRDLWFGSHLLSELSRAAASALVKEGAELVFPPLAAGDPELDPCDGPLRPQSGRPPLAVPNKLVAVVSADVDPGALARAARTAANERWRAFAGTVRRKCKGLLADGIDAPWDEQIATLLEYHAAWLPLDDGDAYDRVRSEVEEAIAARKHLRDFPAWTAQRGSVPKSSLDGARETVLATPQRRAPHHVRRYRIEAGEQLDAVGLVKRAGGEPEQFVPIANVALASWIEQAVRAAGPAVRRLAAACAEIGISRVDRPDLLWTKPFSFDAQVFLVDRWQAILKEAAYPGERREWEKLVQPILDAMSTPHPYVACLVADGDNVGRALEDLGTRERQRAFARELSGFAGKAREVVEQEHRGVLVYAGGDDVLAFVDLDDALSCAGKLRRAFEDVMGQALPEGVTTPTLSVGVGVGHLLESMGHLLELGRRAERRAKEASPGEDGDRNALAIAIDKRAGGELIWRGRWNAASGSPEERLAADAALLDQRLSSKKVHEIESDIRRLPAPGDLVRAEDRPWAELLAADVCRTLLRSTEGEGVTPAEVGLDLDVKAGYGALRRRVERWIERMLVARTFTEARHAREPRRREA